jgi:outer membrane lipoprotein-sorting protein
MKRWEGRPQATRTRSGMGFGAAVAILIAMLIGGLGAGAWAQTDCAEGDSPLDTSAPKDMTAPELIQKFTAQETKVNEARAHYTYTQDVLVQTLSDTGVDGQFHETALVSYDDKGKRVEKVMFAEQSTLRGIQVTAEDMEDIRVFMPFVLTTEDAPEYNLTYAGQQHVDDLDTYVFHLVPKKEEKSKRYFQGKIWVDNRDFQIVKVCGKSVPDKVQAKRGQHMEIRPVFVSYRQLIDGRWFPVYAKVDDTLTFKIQSVHVREIVKWKDYKLRSQ